MTEAIIQDYRAYRISRNEDPDDIYLTKTWPLGFDQENTDILKDIQPCELKEMPQQTSTGQSVNQFIDAHDLKKTMAEKIKVVQIEAKLNGPNPVDQQMVYEGDDSSEEARIKNQQSCIDHSNLAAIRMKQQIQTESKQKDQELILRQENQKQINMLKILADQVNQVIQYQQGASIYIKNLIAKVIDGKYRGSFVSRGK